MSATITLQGTVSCVDSSTGAVPFVKQINMQMAGRTFDVTQGQVISTTPVTIPLPISPTEFVYIGNLSQVNTVTVTWTPNGGASAVVATIPPSTSTEGSGLFLIGSAGIGTAGITSLSVVASAPATSIEYVLGG